MTKEQERDSIHQAIWKICNDLRGAVDGWDFKNYVLGTMFYRYLSEQIAGSVEGYAGMTDTEAEIYRDSLIADKGYFILPSELFCNVCRATGTDLKVQLEHVFRSIEASTKDTPSEAVFAGLFNDFDLDSNKLGSSVEKRNERLAKLLNGIAGMELGDMSGHECDAFGDAYEYLMAMYASSAGKSGGEFFTPTEVSELISRLGTVGRQDVRKVYDPSCGSGSLLLMAGKVLGGSAQFFGQEINATTFNLCRINMLLHGISYNNFNIACEDTLTAPQHWDDQPFDLIVSNPPYSVRWAGSGNPALNSDPRFAPAGVLAPKAKADLAFVMHCAAWLADKGTAAIVCFPGILYRGNAELKIRKYLIDSNLVDAIIQLPSNLFYNTSIATIVLMLRKDKPDNSILFVDASAECITLRKQNKLTQDNIRHIVSLYADRQDVPNVAHVADYETVKKNDYNLSVSMYVEPESQKEEIDIVKLNAEIRELHERNNRNLEKLDALVEEIEEMLRGGK